LEQILPIYFASLILRAIPDKISVTSEIEDFLSLMNLDSFKVKAKAIDDFLDLVSDSSNKGL
jgi:hypothetical protein